MLELTNPVAVQKDPEDDYELNWNLKQIEMSKGLLPGMMMLLALSIGTSHTNVWCRQVKAGVRSLFPDLGNVGGKLDAEVLTHGKPDFKQAVFHEMKWLVLHHQIEQAFPGLIDFVQKALNVTAQNQRGESEVMRDMWTIAEAMEDNVDWSIVEDSAERSLAPCTKYLPAMTKYLKAHSGTLLSEISPFLKMFERESAVPSLGGEYCMAVAEIKPPNHKVPYVGIALLKAGLISPKVVDGYARSIVPSKVEKLKSKKELGNLLKANAMLERGRQLAETMKVSEHANYHKHLGELEVRTVTILLHLGPVFETREWETMEQVEEDSRERERERERDAY